MTEKRFIDDGIEEIENQSFTDNLTEKTYWIDNGLDEIVELLNNFNDENEQLKQQLNKLSMFGNTTENIRLSINYETGKLQKHIYGTGVWFGDFDRILCKSFITENDYQQFIDRIIEVYNTEFSKNKE